MMASMGQSEVLEGLFDQLESDTAVIERTVRVVRTEITAYSAVSDLAISASAKRNLGRAVMTLRDGAVSDESKIWEAEQTTIERLRSGVAIEDMMGGFRVSIACINDRLLELAEERQLPSTEIVRLTRLLWKLSDVFAAQAASTYRKQVVASEIAHQRMKDEWLLSVLTRHLGDDALSRAAEVLEVSALGSFIPFSARPGSDEPLETACERTSHKLVDHGPITTLPSERRIVGLTTAVPPFVHGVVLAIGPAAPFADMRNSFRIAKRVFEAVSGERSGVFGLEHVGWRIGATDDPDLAGLLDDRYIEPLRQTRGSSEHIVEALAAYLRHDQSIPAAAASLHMHVNSLRYRLSRFEELTGRRLSSTDTLIELSWILQHRRGQTL